MAAKTSLSHPLRIDGVYLGAPRGCIGLTLCPGKRQRGAMSGEWARDLETDLKVVRGFGASAVVTLMEDHELASVGVPVGELGTAVAKLGMEWHHLPVRDASIPDEAFEDLWTYTGARLRGLLSQGERIVIHCLGGLGRTGTVGARLLIELGMTADAAIQSVRKARTGTIETMAQEAYVRRCKPAPDAQARALACLLGGALGDAFGYAVEFDSIGAIRARFGSLGIQEPVLQGGKLLVSDDTQMTLFTLEGLLCAEPGPEGFRLAYLDWFRTQQATVPVRGGSWLLARPEMYARRAPGNTCLNALGAGGRGTVGKPINNSKGCGGVMRVAPIGLLKREPAKVFGLAADAAALTHGHPSGYLSAGVLAATIRFLAEGHDLESAARLGCDLLRSYDDHEETLAAVEKAMQAAGRNTNDHVSVVEALGGGWVGEEALAIALYAAMSAESFADAIRIAANHSGDSDSTASIAGQLWGAAHGIEGMPHSWVTALDVLVPLLHLVREMGD